MTKSPTHPHRDPTLPPSRLPELLKAHGITRMRLAGVSQLSPTTVKRIESDPGRCSYSVLWRVCRALHELGVPGVSPDYLAGIEQGPPTEG